MIHTAGITLNAALDPLNAFRLTIEIISYNTLPSALLLLVHFGSVTAVTSPLPFDRSRNSPSGRNPPSQPVRLSPPTHHTSPHLLSCPGNPPGGIPGNPPCPGGGNGNCGAPAAPGGGNGKGGAPAPAAPPGGGNGNGGAPAEPGGGNGKGGTPPAAPPGGGKGNGGGAPPRPPGGGKAPGGGKPPGPPVGVPEAPPGGKGKGGAPGKDGGAPGKPKPGWFWGSMGLAWAWPSAA